MSAIEELVKPFLEQHGINYQASQTGTKVYFGLNCKGKTLHFGVCQNLYNGMPMLTTMTSIVGFPDDPGAAIAVANHLNSKVPGVFFVDDDGDLNYSLDLLVSPQLSPGDYKKSFDLTLAVVSKYHEALMRLRYGGMEEGLTALSVGNNKEADIEPAARTTSRRAHAL